MQYVQLDDAGVVVGYVIAHTDDAIPDPVMPVTGYTLEVDGYVPLREAVFDAQTWQIRPMTDAEKEAGTQLPPEPPADPAPAQAAEDADEDAPTAE